MCVSSDNFVDRVNRGDNAVPDLDVERGEVEVEIEIVEGEGERESERYEVERMNNTDLRCKSFEYYEQKSVGIPTFFRKKILNQLKDGTYFNLSPKEFRSVSYGCLPLRNIHVKSENNNIHIKLTNSQRKHLIQKL